MFAYDRGLRLLDIDLAVDIPRRQPRGFISHAHADHMARHELAFCTPATAKLYHYRLGERTTREMPFGQPLEWGPLRLTTYPAGHVLGSAMLLAESADASLLFTGDFRLGPSETCLTATPPQADILIMESTFGDPRFRLPPREESCERLLEIVRGVLADGATPVIYAYALGKAQEVAALLARNGIAVGLSKEAYEISLIYQTFGCQLGDFQLWSGEPLDGRVLIIPPRAKKLACLAALRRISTISVTGWAHDPKHRRRMATDHAVALSDHADFNSLMQLVEIVAPREIFCTHGPESFVESLRQAGHSARVLSTESRPKRG